MRQAFPDTPEQFIKWEQDLTEWADGLIGDWVVEEIGEIEFDSLLGLSCDANE